HLCSLSRAESRVPHRRDDEFSSGTLAAQMIQQVRCATNLETTRGSDKLALGVDFAAWKKIAKPNQGSLDGDWHTGSLARKESSGASDSMSPYCTKSGGDKPRRFA